MRNTKSHWQRKGHRETGEGGESRRDGMWQGTRDCHEGKFKLKKKGFFSVQICFAEKGLGNSKNSGTNSQIVSE